MTAADIKTISMFDIEVKRVGLVSRDYNARFPNGYRDFSHAMPELLKRLDDAGCDTVLFALYSMSRAGYNLLASLGEFKNLRMIGLEEFMDGADGRKAGDYVVYFNQGNSWYEYRFKQAFGRVNWQSQEAMVRNFARQELQGRVLGNACFLICGESNGVKYDKAGSREVVDICGLRATIPERVKVILNPVHDRMTRFEMTKKRRFLSENGRWVITVWNKGKRDKNGRCKDGPGPAWTVFYDGKEVEVPRLTSTPHGIEVALVSIVSSLTI